MSHIKKYILSAAISLFVGHSVAQEALELGTGQKMRVDIYSGGTFRIQLNREGNFNRSLMERYEILNSAMSPEQTTVSKTDAGYTIGSANYKLLVDSKTGSFTLQDNNGKTLKQVGINDLPANRLQQFSDAIREEHGDITTREAIIGDTTKDLNKKNEKPADVQADDPKSTVSFRLQPHERLYGAGAASRKNIQHRGESLRNWATYQKSDMATPFLMSIDGWGIYNNTTRLNYFDVGKFSKDDLLVYNTEDKIDLFLFIGNDMYDILNKYTYVAGRSYLLPTWAYGMAFGGNKMENQFDLMNNAVRFRDEKIPCDLFWIEPQWMAKYYDTSTSKTWNQNMYPGEVFWEEKTNKKKYEQPFLFIGRLHKLGYKLALWLCIDHDLSVEAEDELAAKQGRPLSGKEHWFPHLMNFVDQGVDGFKLDPGRTLDEHPHREYYNGLTDKEMHNMNQVLMPKQSYTTFRNHTGRRVFHHYCGAWAGTQRWAASTSGDNGGGRDALYDQVNLSMSGFVNTAIEVMEVTNRTFDPETNLKLALTGMHFGFFMPWVQIDSWYALHQPWYLSPAEKEAVTFYARLRNMMHPYIYSAAIEGSRSGKPILRAMPLEYPQDTTVQNMVYQYMFGDNLLVGVFNDSIYLPKGNWINYWSGKSVAGGQTVHAEVPKNRGGALFIKAGAIIPFKKLSQYVEEFPNDTLTVKVYPEGESSYTLLQDDGISFEYENGQVAETKFHCSKNNNRISFSIDPVKGTYKNIPEKVVYKVEMAVKAKPKKVILNDKSFSQWKWENEMLLLDMTGSASDTSKLDVLL